MSVSFSFIDVLVIILFIAGLVGIGIYESKKVKTADSFSVADRSFTMKIMLGTTVATCLGAGSAVGNLGNTWTMGVAMIAIQGMWHIGWLVLVLFAKRLRESNASSLADFFFKKFGTASKVIASIVILCFVVNVTASQVAATATIVSGFGLMSYKGALVVAGLVIILFTVFSGLYGVALTDTVQAVFIVGGIGIVLPIVVFGKSGGLGAVFANMAATAPEKLSLSSVGFGTLIAWLLSYLLAASSNPGYIQRILACKDIKTARWGTVWSDVICLVIGTIMMLMVFAMPILFPTLENGNLFVPTAIMAYFPIGIRALIICALIGQILSTADSFLLLIGTTVAQDIYPVFKPEADEKKIMLLTRVFIVVGGIFAIFLGLGGAGILVIFKTGASAIGAGLAIPLVCACFIPQVKAKAINPGMLFGCFSTIIWNQFFKASTGIDGVIIGAAGCALIILFVTLLTNKSEKLPA